MKINNCIAKKSFIVLNNKTSTKGKKFILVENKANLVNAKDVKSNFKALELRKDEISRVRL